MSSGTTSLLSALVGEELASVVFVRDYLQLDFDGPRLTLYVWPQIGLVGEVRRGLGDPGYRDALCTLIGHTVVSAVESAEIGLLIDFDLGCLVVKPEPTELTGPEIAMLAGFTGQASWMVWRPGEPPFDGAVWC